MVTVVALISLIGISFAAFPYAQAKQEIWAWVGKNPNHTPEGLALIEGDIIMTFDQVQQRYGPDHQYISLNLSRAAISNRRWPRTINYIVDGSRSDLRQSIRDALDDMQQNTCLRFVEQTIKPSGPHINVVKKNGCWASLGMSDDGQELSLGDGCEARYTIQHEFMHALGCEHEHQRPDRDDHVVVFVENLAEEHKIWYQKLNNSNTFSIPYDYGSIMHYSIRAFSKTGNRVMTTKNPTDEYLIGRNENKMTFRDIALVNAMYNCSSSCSSNSQCQNGGFMDQRCRCRCPPKTSGELCQTTHGNYYPENDCPVQTITKETIITSRNFPNNYPANLRCFTRITPPAGRKVRIRFTDFSLTPRDKGSNKCLWDVLEIRWNNIYDAEPADMYCENELQNIQMDYPIGREVLLYFSTVYYDNKGFRAQISFVQEQ